jgi:signal transduction histidine kinase
MSEDISNESQEELVEKIVIERMSHISSELAHDLRSPLQTIQNAIYLLEKSPDNTMLFDLVRQSLRQATSLLDSFRDYYKGHVINPLDTDIGRVIDLAFSDLEIPNNIKVNRGNSTGILVKVDPAKTALAIRNLVINGIDAMPEGGTLDILISESTNTISIDVIDSGEGVSPEFTEFVFVPFKTNKSNGKGLGVPTSQRIIESHGGSLSFTSKPGEGTRFTAVIPK